MALERLNPSDGGSMRRPSQLETLPVELRLRIYSFLGFPTDSYYKYYTHPAMFEYSFRDGERANRYRLAGPTPRPNLTLYYPEGSLIDPEGHYERPTFQADVRIPHARSLRRGRMDFCPRTLCIRPNPRYSNLRLLAVSSVFARDLFPIVYNEQVMYDAHLTDIWDDRWLSTICTTYIGELLLALPRMNDGEATKDLEQVLERIARHCTSLKVLSLKIRETSVPAGWLVYEIPLSLRDGNYDKFLIRTQTRPLDAHTLAARDSFLMRTWSYPQPQLSKYHIAQTTPKVLSAVLQAIDGAVRNSDTLETVDLIFHHWSPRPAAGCNTGYRLSGTRSAT